MSEPIDFLQEVSDFVFTSKYSRYNEKEKRRETWTESVSRLEKMHLKRFSWLSKEDIAEIKWAFDKVREKLVVPSMRSLQFGGKAIEAHEARIFNCATRHVDSIRSFAEIYYLLLCGCGVGIGLSKKYLDRLPDLVNAEDKTGIVVTYTVEDSITGWADSAEALLMCYFKNTAFTGRKIVFDYSAIRRKGAPLKTGGGKAPGYKGLKHAHDRIKELLDFVIEEKGQTRLKSINAYDLLMHCGDSVLSGGVRRTATSVVFDPDDTEMMNAKTYFTVDKHRRFAKDDETGKYHGQVIIDKKIFDVALSDYDYKELKEKKIISWFHVSPQRARSNNSIRLSRTTVTKEDFKKIITNSRQFGEPGFAFVSVDNQLFNPCFEIGFVPVTKDGRCGVQYCNLTSMNGRLIDSEEKFREATKAATIIGTLQAAYTHYPYLSNTAKELTEEEALLGISITGMMDNPHILLNPEIQRRTAQYAKETNKTWAAKIKINSAARVTCIKPEGTASLVLGTASGIHPHHARRYIRRVQCNRQDNIFRHFRKINTHAVEESIYSVTKTDDVVSFPVTVSSKAIIKSDLTAVQHLEYVKSTQQNWVLAGTTEFNKKPISHNVSVTVLVKDDEWDKVIDYLYDNREYFAAVSLLPANGDKVYAQAPLEAIITSEDERRWNDLVSKWQHVDYKALKEDDDETDLQSESGCAGGKCEL